MLIKTLLIIAQFSKVKHRMQKLILIFFSLLLSLSSVAQSTAEKIQILIEDGEYFTEEEDYEQAYHCYDKLTKLDKNDIGFKYQKGMSALHLPTHKAEAIDLFLEVYKADPKHFETLYYLGRAYHANYKFDDAIINFKKFIAEDPKSKLIDEANQYIRNSEFGMNVMRTMVDADIKNLGSPLNTKAEEYVPVISADESVLIFTYKGAKSIGGKQDRKFRPDPDGTYFEDIYISYKKDSTWDAGKSIGSNINTNHHDASIALSPDGQTLFTYSSDVKDRGDIYECKLEGDKWSAPVRLQGEVNTKYWEGSCSITADGNYLYFASERPGGLGGRDLYVATKKPDGTWGNIQNLGPAINTKYNDDAPFIHPDGVTLFFSSEGHTSIGGYDIMYSHKKDNQWLEPKNMGFPLNTTDDDRFYVITANGERGYFSSNRESKGGNGSEDIFTVTPGVIGEKPILAMLDGNIYGNDLPIEASIEIIKKSTNEKIGPFKSNSKTGKYLVALSPGEVYYFNVSHPDFPAKQDTLDIAHLGKYVELKIDFYLERPPYHNPRIDTAKHIPDLLKDTNKVVVKVNTPVVDTPKVDTPRVDTPRVDTPLVVNNANPCAEFKMLDFSALKSKSLNDPVVYAKLLAIGNKICAGKMEFKVQIAAYKFPKNFKYDRLKQFGEPEVKDYPDGLTRFTQGSFDGINKAEELRQKIIAKGQKDAWIVGFIDGKRYTLEELIMVDFYNKDIASFNESLQLLQEFIVVK